MTTPVSRRTVLTAGAASAAVAATLGLPAATAEAHARRRTEVRFTLNAEVLDGGEQITSLTLKTKGLGWINPASLSTTTFTVHAKATSPIPLAGDLIFSEYDLDRVVTKAHLDRRGNIVLHLAHGEGQVGGGTLGYIVGRARNVQLDLVYTITQNTPLTLRNRRSVMINTFVQGQVSNPEVDSFGYGVSTSKINYRLFTPDHDHHHGSSHSRGKRGRPLIVWLHGGGEGGSLADNYYDNESQLRANRGALGFVTDEAQEIFGGAYVVAPQSTSFWIEDGPRFAPLIKEVIDEVCRKHAIDRDRIYVVGCSNGGYMSLKITSVYRDLFAASVPICGVVDRFRDGPVLVSDDELRAIRTPTWLVTSLDDTTVPPVANTVHAHSLIPQSLATLYDTVTWDGYRFNGHWSWIYVARNDPTIDGTRVWQWMARQRR